MTQTKSVTVLTPTTGSADLIDALISVANQDYAGQVTHLVVVDGQEFLPETERVIELSGTNPTVMVLPYNTGADGWLGHRIYASVPFLIDSDYIAFLDQDNWYEVDHISSMVSKIEKNESLELVFSLRSIYEKNKTYVTNDNCESLGLWPIWNSGNSRFLIDTNCYLFKTEFIRRTGRMWMHRVNADAHYTMHLAKHFKGKYDTTGMYTVNYRVGGRINSVTKEFFLVGNIYHMEMYPGGNYPWRKQ